MKRLHCMVLLAINCIAMIAHATDSMYCPQRQGYITVGMSQNQVINACGQPSIKRTSNNPVMKNTPVTQLIYSTLNRGAVYPGWTNVYNMWSLPSGSNGVTLQINIVDQKVADINLNGNSTNAISICRGTSIQKGDNVNKVYSLCGSPSLSNNTYISTPVPESEAPQVWIYQVNEYEAPFSLTFINGTLQSIN